MIVSTHARERIRKRFGIPASAAVRFAETAFKRGVLAESVSDSWRIKQHNDYSVLLVIYRSGLFVYGLSDDGKEPVLVTVVNKAA